MNDPLNKLRPGPPGFDPVADAARLRRAQRARATVMALLLGAFVVLMFAISIVKIRNGG